MLWFILGCMFGGCCGIFTMCLVSINKDDDWKDRR